jgi:hypothetical protein
VRLSVSATTSLLPVDRRRGTRSVAHFNAVSNYNQRNPSAASTLSSISDQFFPISPPSPFSFFFSPPHSAPVRPSRFPVEIEATNTTNQTNKNYRTASYNRVSSSSVFFFFFWIIRCIIPPHTDTTTTAHRQNSSTCRC